MVKQGEKPVSIKAVNPFLYQEDILELVNVGPTAISRMRIRAKELGYDSDKWFNNVEIVTLKEIGIQPVDYVRNIEKYYLAYSLSEFCEADRKKIIADDME